MRKPFPPRRRCRVRAEPVCALSDAPSTLIHSLFDDAHCPTAELPEDLQMMLRDEKDLLSTYVQSAGFVEDGANPYDVAVAVKLCVHLVYTQHMHITCHSTPSALQQHFKAKVEARLATATEEQRAVVMQHVHRLVVKLGFAGQQRVPRVERTPSRHTSDSPEQDSQEPAQVCWIVMVHGLSPVRAAGEEERACAQDADSKGQTVRRVRIRC